jgi:hypothetical protein
MMCVTCMSLVFGRNGIGISFNYLGVVLYREIKAQLLVNNTLARWRALLIGLDHVRVILFGAYYLIAGFTSGNP